MHDDGDTGHITPGPHSQTASAWGFGGKTNKEGAGTPLMGDRRPHSLSRPVLYIHPHRYTHLSHPHRYTLLSHTDTGARLPQVQTPHRYTLLSHTHTSTHPSVTPTKVHTPHTGTHPSHRYTHSPVTPTKARTLTQVHTPQSHPHRYMHPRHTHTGTHRYISSHTHRGTH